MAESADRKRIADLEAENQRLRDIIDGLPASSRLPQSITKTEARILRMLAKWPAGINRYAIYDALYSDRINGGPDTKIIDVHMAHIRKKVRAAGVIIDTIHGVGFRVSEASRAAIMALFEPL